MIHFNNTIEKCFKFFVHNQIFFILKLKCVSFEIGIFLVPSSQEYLGNSKR